MTGQLVKLALKRDNSIPMGQPAPMHLDCPCGQQLPIGNLQIVACSACGARYDASGWKL